GRREAGPPQARPGAEELLVVPLLRLLRRDERGFVLARLLQQLHRDGQALDDEEEEEQQEPRGLYREVAAAQLAQRLKPLQDAVRGLVLRVEGGGELVLALHRRVVLALHDRQLVLCFGVPLRLARLTRRGQVLVALLDLVLDLVDLVLVTGDLV